jgi:hypothetical protein
MRLMILAIMNAMLLLAAIATSAEERVLLPVHLQTEGAFGSKFTTDLIIHNFGSTDLRVRGVDIFCPLSACLDPDPNESLIAAGRTVDDFFHAGSPGRFLVVPDGATLEFALRARDYSRAAFSAGVDIPVISEDQFISRPFSLLNIYNDGSQFRSRLRIYGSEQTSVSLRFLSQGNENLVDERVVELSTPTSEFEPAYYELGALPQSSFGRPLRIEVTSLSPTTPLWGFVTMTNNVTQEITLATPYVGASLESGQ